MSFDPWLCKWCHKRTTMRDVNHDYSMHKDCYVEYMNASIRMVRKFFETENATTK